MFQHYQLINIETVPVAFGKVCVLSAVGSVNAKVVSKALSVAPSKDIVHDQEIQMIVC